jgi:hypothetical protein
VKARKRIDTASRWQPFLDEWSGGRYEWKPGRVTAIRTALGATRFHLLRSGLVEALLLAAIGSAA